MKKFSPNHESGNGFQSEQCGDFAIARSGRKFFVAKWNRHHQNWVRKNKDGSSAMSARLSVLSADNLGGGPVLMTLSDAREYISDHS